MLFDLDSEDALTAQHTATRVTWMSEFEYLTVMISRIFMSLLSQCTIDIRESICTNCLKNSLTFLAHVGKQS